MKPVSEPLRAGSSGSPLRPWVMHPRAVFGPDDEPRRELERWLKPSLVQGPHDISVARTLLHYLGAVVFEV
ncbi:hypothetical protein NHX12_007287 [Muraenolepis orangiensis]|uniref:Uncharacterized protein n=1 Tax=Muraenolepis orangiensis TaxID=630683 RepID=A0A9Q0D3K4_9TELE|nr:hypothetical protein NHX12_016982 [Muraenolepis orangiensis]KAJ3592158.1 hypothetical protein NHX12_007287 [Muraenolepis orangiensis]